MFGVLDRPQLAVAPLRVAVEARDPVRQAGLAALVAAAGHDVVTASEAELCLVDAIGVSALPQLVLSDGTDMTAPASILSPSVTVRQLDAALRAVAAGLIVRAAEPPGRANPGLTPREAEILACLSDGASNKAIARRLGISQHTVKFHVEAVFTKLAVTSRSEAVARALRTGLIGL